MPKKPQFPTFEWVHGLDSDDSARLIGWLYAAAKYSPAIAREFADFKAHLEKRSVIPATSTSSTAH